MFPPSDTPGGIPLLRTIKGGVGEIFLITYVLAAWVIGFQSLVRMIALVAFPFPHDGLEGTLLYEARLLRSGQPLYQPLELYRFVSAPYPPVHYLFLALFDLIPGPHVFFGGRLLSAIATIMIVIVIGVHAGRASGHGITGVMAAAMAISIPPLILWGTRIKPDTIALMCTSVGLLATSLALDSVHDPKRLRLLWFAALCFVVAFFTKQTSVVGPLAAGIALLVADVRDWYGMPDSRVARSLRAWCTSDHKHLAFVALGGRKIVVRWRTVLFSTLYFVLVFAIWGMLEFTTRGQYNLHVWWSGDRTEWWSFSTFRNVIRLLMFWWPMMILSLVGVIIAWWQRAAFVAAAYLLVAPITLLGAGEVGANHNHLLEVHIALVLAGSIAITWACINLMRYWSIAIPCIVLVIMQLYQLQTPPKWYENQLDPRNTPARFLDFMRSTPGEILADDIGLLFQAGKPLRYNDPSTMGPAARIGKWDQRGLIDDIANKRFSAIMIPINAEETFVDNPNNRWTPEVLAAIRQHYRLLYRDTIFTYVPNDR